MYASWRSYKFNSLTNNSSRITEHFSFNFKERPQFQHILILYREPKSLKCLVQLHFFNKHPPGSQWHLQKNSKGFSFGFFFCCCLRGFTSLLVDGLRNFHSQFDESFVLVFTARQKSIKHCSCNHLIRRWAFIHAVANLPKYPFTFKFDKHEIASMLYLIYL